MHIIYWNSRKSPSNHHQATSQEIGQNLFKTCYNVYSTISHNHEIYLTCTACWSRLTRGWRTSCEDLRCRAVPGGTLTWRRRCRQPSLCELSTLIAPDYWISEITDLVGEFENTTLQTKEVDTLLKKTC